MRIRSAVSEDTPALIDMGKRMRDESPRFSQLGFSEEKCAALIDKLLDPKIGAIFVAEQDGVIVGMMGGVVVEHFFSEDRYAADLVVFIAPEHRGGSAFIKLVIEFEEWAAEQGACEIVLGISTEVATDRTVMMYERLGYMRQQGCTLIKRFTDV